LCICSSRAQNEIPATVDGLEVSCCHFLFPALASFFVPGTLVCMCRKGEAG